MILSDVADEPRARIELPLVRLGDRLQLRFRLRRQKGGRTEELQVAGEFRVAAMVIDTTHGHPKQVVHISSLGVVPVWRAVKNPPPSRFPLIR